MEEIDRLVDQKRPELEQTFFRKHNQLIATTEVFRQTLESCKSRGWDTHAQLWNIGIYINIAAHDLWIFSHATHGGRETWTRRQLARHVVLTMYEVAEDMTQLLGKRIRESLEILHIIEV